MTREEAANRLQNVIRVWELSLAKMPPEVQTAQTTLVVLRAEDIEAMRVLVAAVRNV